MTAKLAMIAGLVLLLLLQGWGGLLVWREQPPRPSGAQEKQPAGGKPMPPAPGRVSLQPTTPASPPDFNQGYLFNAERSLAADGGAKGQKAQNAVNVGWDKVQYNGSIITGTETKALLSYPQGGQPSGGSGLVAGGAMGAQGFLRVVVGDTVNGYKVTEILPGRIVFAKGDQKISKSLYEKGKQRFQAQAAASPAPAEQPQAASGAPAPPGPAKPAEAMPTPRKRLEPQQESGERRAPTPRKRPLPPKDSPAPDAKNVLQMLIERQRQLNQSRPPEEKKFTP